MIDNGWKKLNEYFATLDQSPAYYLSVALHPQMKLKYLKEEWSERPEWFESAQRTAEDYWSNRFKPESNQTLANDGVANQNEENDSDLDDDWQGRVFKRARLDLDSIMPENDAFVAFQSKRPVPIQRGISFDVIGYWFQQLNSAQTNEEKALARMALTVLCTPAMSTEVERTFSSTKRTLSDSRNRMEDDVIEYIECLKAWEKEGFALVVNGMSISIEDFDRAIKSLDLLR